MTILKTDYDRSARVSQTQLRTLAKSPRIFEAMYITKEMSFQATPAMEMGTMIHAYILQPDWFASTYVAIPPDVLTANGQRRGKAWEAFVDDLAAAGKRPIFASELETLEKIAKRIAANSEATILLNSARSCDRMERPIYWDDDLSGVKCKGIPDAVCQTEWIVDLKTTSDLDNFFFDWKKNWLGIQAAAYLRGARSEYQEDFQQFAYIVIETKEPYRVRCCFLSQEQLFVSERQLDSLLREYVRRLERNDWSERGEKGLCVLSREFSEGLNYE